MSGASGSPAPKMRTSADIWQPEGASLESFCSASCAQNTARTETGAVCFSCHSRRQTCPGNGGVPCLADFSALLRKCKSLQIAGRQKGLAWKAVAQPHLPMAVLAQSRRPWGCLLVLPPQTSNIFRGSLSGVSGSATLKIQTSADSWQPEGASLESCCSASSAHDTARTEAQRLGLLACLATSNFKRLLCCP